MIALDTNVLARFYIEDPEDDEAIVQNALAKDLVAAGVALFVPLTVIAEFEWLARSYYKLPPAGFAKIVRHLAGLPHVTLELTPRVMAAVQDHLDGLDFSDALHLRACDHCEAMFSFDDRKFARRARKLGLRPDVRVPA
ncbi:type II toxin-antitoxin system VapC family toxin [Ramlibacter albus]|uniref:Type II toxin-antitoxin system VapC family toxin n=1 Tax=Ramlibacter albus TaxID=2079448 RepID=A0A923MD51_9BURK|nr:type II toxin-antitoxin system VapC family toxin [Ramlibacter albus]